MSKEAKDFLKARGLKNPPLDSGIGGAVDLERRYVSDLMEEYANRFKPQWIPVSERLPEDKQRVLCCQESGVLWNSFEFWINPDDKTSKLFLNYDYPFGNSNITHWQPLPTPPNN